MLSLKAVSSFFFVWWAQAPSTGLCFLRTARSPVDDPVGERPRQRVDEQCEEDCGDEQEQRQDDVLLVVAPHQVEETLEGVGEPGEGGVRTAGVGGAKEQRFSQRRSTDFLLLLYFQAGFSFFVVFTGVFTCWSRPPEKIAKTLFVLHYYGNGMGNESIYINEQCLLLSFLTNI